MRPGDAPRLGRLRPREAEPPRGLFFSRLWRGASLDTPLATPTMKAQQEEDEEEEEEEEEEEGDAGSSAQSRPPAHAQLKTSFLLLLAVAWVGAHKENYINLNDYLFGHLQEKRKPLVED
ncbi:uncharacterized protein LOC134293811 [Anolis carolinensis]|uniref:uncharacterized protein LOC134293811 n=1 Tax=Anolis carolinensis TaxID=28377 RepID=UPI002F2B1B42